MPDVQSECGKLIEEVRLKDIETLLESYADIKEMADQLSERIETLRSKMFSLQSIVIDGQPHGTTVMKGGKHEDLICDYLMLIEDYENVLARENTTMMQIEKLIQKLPEDEQKVMREHYITGASWDETARNYFYSRRKVFNLRRSAIEKLRK